MGGNLNVGYLVMNGTLTQETDGYATRIRKTCVPRPNTKVPRSWERKRDAALTTIVRVSTRTSVFWGKFLHDLRKKPGCKKNKAEKEEVTAKTVIDSAKKRLQAMLQQLKIAKTELIFAEKSAILEVDTLTVQIAKRQLNELETKVTALSKEVESTRNDPTLDSAL